MPEVNCGCLSQWLSATTQTKSAKVHL